MDISKKLVTLMVLLPGTDVNTLTRLKVTKMFITENEFSFTSDKVLRTLALTTSKNQLLFKHI